MTSSGLTIHGIYRDVLRDREQRVVHDSGWVKNTIVNRCRVLLASFVKNEPAASGIRHLAVGRGQASWDAGGIPASTPDLAGLVEAYTPPIDVNDLELDYLDDLAGEVQQAPAASLQITATLEPGYPEPVGGLNTYPLREFGLFGELDGAPYMINSIRHPVIHKDAGATLIRVVRLYF